MMHRFFQIQPCYNDPHTFCSITVGSGRARANIQIYIDEDMLKGVVRALVEENLVEEQPLYEDLDRDAFWFQISVIPLNQQSRIVRFQLLQWMLDDGAPFAFDMKFVVSSAEAAEFSSDLSAWLNRMDYSLEWKLD